MTEALALVVHLLLALALVELALPVVLAGALVLTVTQVMALLPWSEEKRRGRHRK